MSAACSYTWTGLSTLSASFPRQTGPTHLHSNPRIARQRSDTADLRQQEETLRGDTERWNQIKVVDEESRGAGGEEGK